MALPVSFPAVGPRRFFALQAGTWLFLWAIIRITSGVDFFRQAYSFPVVTRPSWLPLRAFLFLRRPGIYLTACYCLPLALVVAAWQPSAVSVRLCAALLGSIYSLVESSATNSHRDYPMLYNLWALALLPPRWAEGVALGVCLHFVASSGLAKLYIGGLEWLGPGPLESVLRTYGDLSFSSGGPGSPKMSKLVRDSPLSMSLLDRMTLLYEVLVVPAALFLPPSARLAVGLGGMICLHLGIYVFQSAIIGVFFIPNVATYTLGFGSNLEVGDAEWYASPCLFCLSIGYVALTRSLLPENWPLTPFALFGWSGSQWDALHDTFVRSETRLVMSAGLMNGPLGLKVVGRGIRGSSCADDEDVVYDFWDVLLGDTMVHNDILRAIDFETLGSPLWDPASFTRRVETWLSTHRRVIELRSSRALVSANFVRVDDRGFVDEVIA
eukprot:TRINITY_DN29522_c0_g1_i1.p1 TRINITY_DN29522_c0_g1~~TRINITY_DN29522_c0_g1_i1.p1  ORF type:complete len:448 (+),score=47.42 TRINITY_DN29522_c0_g1_i1:30-1346(+)